jgi:hypothetical protein
MGASKFTREDLIRAEICWEIEDCFGVTFSPEEVPGWQTVGDIHWSLTAGIRARFPGAVDADAAWAWLRVVLAEMYGLEVGQVVPDAELFGRPLWLMDRDPAPWEDYFRRKDAWRMAATAVVGPRPTSPEPSSSRTGRESREEP